MFLARRPTDAAVREFLTAQSAEGFTYRDVGATRSEPPAGFVVDRHRVELGRGRATFDRAVQAVREWRMFELGWAELLWPTAPIEPQSTVAVLVRLPGFWSLNACRVVYVVNEEVPIRRFGFAYGTLPDHAEQGEERFSVEWRPDDSVWYDLLAFSRPHQWQARLGRGFSRALQKRFARGSTAAMVAAVGESGP